MTLHPDLALNTGGEIVFDPTLPVEDATAAIDAGTVVYARALGLGLAGRAARLEVVVPYTWGSAEGLFLGEQTRICGDFDTDTVAYQFTWLD